MTDEDKKRREYTTRLGSSGVMWRRLFPPKSDPDPAPGENSLAGIGLFLLSAVLLVAAWVAFSDGDGSLGSLYVGIVLLVGWLAWKG